MVRPRLKSVNCVAEGGTLLLSLDPRKRVELADRTGQVRALLALLGEGARTPDELCSALAEQWPDLEQREVDTALEMLDGLGWLEDAAAPRRLSDYERERYFSNLAFFDAFTTLERDREEIQMRLIDSHVVVLGAGGLGSAVVQNLAGLGVSALTLLDFDLVELRNFARQFTYTEAQRGLPKVEQVAAWVHAFDSRIDVTAVNTRVDGTRRRSRAAFRRGPRRLRDRRSRRGRPLGQRGLRRRGRAVHPRRPVVRAGAVLVRRSRAQRLPPLSRALPRRSRAGRRPPRGDLGARAQERACQPRNRTGRTVARLARGDGGVALSDRHRAARLRRLLPTRRLLGQLLDLRGSMAAESGLPRLRDRSASDFPRGTTEDGVGVSACGMTAVEAAGASGLGDGVDARRARAQRRARR